jgi:hypothetical protein
MKIPPYSEEQLEAFAETFLKGFDDGIYDGRSVRIEAVIERHGLTIWRTSCSRCWRTAMLDRSSKDNSNPRWFSRFRFLCP